MRILCVQGLSERLLFTLCVLIGNLTPVGCLSPSAESYRPLWWDNPHKHDSDFLYFKAEGKSAVGLEQARQEALKDIKTMVAEYICAEVQLQQDEQSLRSTFRSRSVAELRGVEVIDESDWRTRGESIVWMLGRYPRQEYNRVRQKMALGTQLELQWRKAQSAVNRQSEEEIRIRINN